MNCPKCNKEVSHDWELCPYCGYKPKKCSNSNCNSGWLSQEAKFCPVCGSNLSEQDPVGQETKITFEKETFMSVSFWYNTLLSQEGMLTLYDDKAVFKVGKLALGDRSDKILPIGEICGYRRNLGPLKIYLRDGKSLRIGLPIWNETDLIEALEKRRHAIYTNQGKPVPPLSKF